MSTIQNIQGSSAAAALAAAAQAAPPTSAPKAAPEAKAPTTDTVQISGAARSAVLQSRSTPAQEAAETPAQTAKEASGGDAQAKAKLASEQASRKGVR